MFILSSLKVVIFVAIITRLFYLQISENIKWRTLSDKNRLREWKTVPQRGVIEDFFGKKIADGDPKKIMDSKEVKEKVFPKNKNFLYGK